MNCSLLCLQELDTKQTVCVQDILARRMNKGACLELASVFSRAQEWRLFPAVLWAIPLLERLGPST